MSVEHHRDEFGHDGVSFFNLCQARSGFGGSEQTINQTQQHESIARVVGARYPPRAQPTRPT